MGLAVYSLAYEAAASDWLGTSMPLQDRAVNIFETLLTEPGLRTGPIVFVCHSLGGLLVKKLLLNLQQQAMRRPEAADLPERVTEIVFAASRVDLPSALGSYRDGLAIRDKLVKSDLGNAGWQRDLSVSFGRLATVLMKQNESANALSSLRQGRDILLGLTERSPENVVWKRDLGWFDGQIDQLTH